MSEPLLLTATSGHNWITFETYDTPQWHKAIEWLRRKGYVESGASVLGLYEGILPSYVNQDVTIAAGFDNWSGNYPLAECAKGDQVILNVANYVSAKDCRPAA